MILVNINKKPIELNDNTSLAEALSIAGVVTTGIAVAINETVVPKVKYDTYHLSNGDNILIIKAFYGG